MPGVLLGETVSQSVAMFKNPPHKIVCHADVKRAAWPARQHIDPIAFMVHFSMDCRIKSGNDEMKSDPPIGDTQRAKDGLGGETPIRAPRARRGRRESRRLP